MNSRELEEKKVRRLAWLGQMGTGESGVRAMKGVQATLPQTTTIVSGFPMGDNTTNFAA